MWLLKSSIVFATVSFIVFRQVKCFDDGIFNVTISYIYIAIIAKQYAITDDCLCNSSLNTCTCSLMRYANNHDIFMRFVLGGQWPII